MRKQNKGIGNLKAFTVAGVFMLALFMPAFLCGCGDNSEGDTLLLSFNSEAADMQEIFPETEETTQIVLHSEEVRQIYVYVCGAVNYPDVYQAEEGSRLFELIEMAGGFTPDAAPSGLNLARSVTDGEKIRVFTEEELAQGMTVVSENDAALSGAGGGLVNINTASLSELTGVSGIGESRAQAIIDYREKNGAFRSIEEIKKVDGIKDGLFSKIKDSITI